ncbi:putative cation-transporting ATPase [Astathelohania contejeani]|uniref:Cation-transporting ATPase n=1 Tax=Astathelohania contejeani TaxID=164912 RepID=A0ABQ7HXJ7_9MICR|nr:putative cation-transporting ATPase [Thelohania contejeani]
MQRYKPTTHDEEYITLEGRRPSSLRFIYYALCISTLGIFYIIVKHFPVIKYALTTKSCPLINANYILATNCYAKKELVKIETIVHGIETASLKRYLRNGKARVVETQYMRFIYDYELNRFVIPPPYNCCQAKTRKEKRIIYGPNIIDVKQRSIKQIILDNILSPLFLYIIGCVMLWCFINYKFYASIMLIASVYSLSNDIYRDICARREALGLAGITRYAMLFRNGKWVSTDTRSLYPGDIISIDTVTDFFCDVRVIKGECIIDESFLTGETVPISRGEGSIVYAGTKILKSQRQSDYVEMDEQRQFYKVRNLIKRNTNNDINNTTNNSDINMNNNDITYDINGDVNNQLSSPAIGVVISTGFNTARGRLIRSILIPHPPTFRFYKQAIQFMGGMFGLGVLLTLLTILFLYIRKVSFIDALVYSLDLFTCLLAPALPTTIWIGLDISAKRLNRKNVRCTDNKRINSAGVTDIVIFDKTGTLTEDGLDVLCFDNGFESYTKFEEMNLIIRNAISSCHAVRILEEEYIGDPLDIKMFLFTGNKLNEDGIIETKDGNIKIVQTFEFDAKLRRMSVLVDLDGGGYNIFTKGSPETLLKILKDIPEDYEERVRDFTLEGYRVLAMGYKPVNNDIIDRNLAEKDLFFLGFLVFANKLKPVTHSVLSDLTSAGIKCIMATGDNLLTAVSVGRECNLIDKYTPVIFPIIDDHAKDANDVEWVCIGDDELTFDKITLSLYKGGDRISYSEFYIACEGREYEFFREGDQTYFNFILSRGMIFARMNPDQKKMLVEDFGCLGYSTCFCGDGANDCGALKSAEVGVALVQSGSTLTSSFTSSVMDISSVISVITEGRSSLVTGMSNFKFVLTTAVIQYISLALLSCILFFMSEMQTIHNDLIVVLPLAYLMTQFEPNPTLCKNRPCDVLFRKDVIIQLAGHLIIQTFWLIVSLAIFYEPEGKLSYCSRPSTALFFVSVLQNTFLGLVYTQGTPFRQSIKENYFFMSFYTLITLSTLCLLILHPICPTLIKDLYEFHGLKRSEYGVLCVIIILNGVSIFVYERFVSKMSIGISGSRKDIEEEDEEL